MIQERHLQVLLAPHMSEKAVKGTETRGEYVFKVAVTATKPLVKSAVEKLFNTQVAAVRILNVKSKPRRFGQVKGRSKGWKKAYVTLVPGQQINIAEDK